MIRALRGFKSETKTSRDVKRDRIHDWKALANHLDSTTPRKILQISRRSLRLEVCLTRQRITRPVQQKPDDIEPVATATTHWTCSRRPRELFQLEAHAWDQE
jgi:uncharacterized protein YijF (DUF1287 family)